MDKLVGRGLDIDDETLGGVIDPADVPLFRQLEQDGPPLHWLDRLPQAITIPASIILVMVVAFSVIAGLEYLGGSFE